MASGTATTERGGKRTFGLFPDDIKLAEHRRDVLIRFGIGTKLPDRERRRSGISAICRLDAPVSEAFSNVNDVFAIEGECASAYFAAWNGLPIAWTGTARRPVPKQWRSYAGRRSLAAGVKPENRNASHPANALLNYAYAVKLARAQIDAVANGYDPMFGMMHNGRKDSPGFALDMIEPHRPAVDGLF